jgi:cell division protein YceG involved in septum cleavage
MAQKTAVEWLEYLYKEGILIPKSFEIAKQKEKDQIIDAKMHTFDQNNTLPYGTEYLLKRYEMLEDSFNYYNETYANK